MSPWPTVSRRQLTEGRFISAFQDEILIGEGVTGTWEWFDLADAVRVVAVDQEGRIALVEDEFYQQQPAPAGGGDGLDRATPPALGLALRPVGQGCRGTETEGEDQ